MSLRTVHILFITTALGLLAFMAYWSALRMNTALLLCSLGGGIAGLIYLPWFIKKTKSLR